MHARKPGCAKVPGGWRDRGETTRLGNYPPPPSPPVPSRSTSSLS
jgi:hypothetical protein